MCFQFSGSCLYVLEDHDSLVTSCAFSEDTSFFATGLEFIMTHTYCITLRINVQLNCQIVHFLFLHKLLTLRILFLQILQQIFNLNQN